MIQGYGLTETSPVTHVNRPHGEIRPGTIGQPLIGTECRIVDPETGDGRRPRASAASSGSAARR